MLRISEFTSKHSSLPLSKKLDGDFKDMYFSVFRPVLATKQISPYFNLVSYREGCLKSEENILSVNGIVFEIDNPGPHILHPAAVTDSPAFDGISWYLYATLRHMENSVPKFNVVVPFSKPFTDIYYWRGFSLSLLDYFFYKNKDSVNVSSLIRAGSVYPVPSVDANIVNGHLYDVKRTAFKGTGEYFDFSEFKYNKRGRKAQPKILNWCGFNEPDIYNPPCAALKNLFGYLSVPELPAADPAAMGTAVSLLGFLYRKSHKYRYCDKTVRPKIWSWNMAPSGTGKTLILSKAVKFIEAADASMNSRIRDMLHTGFVTGTGIIKNMLDTGGAALIVTDEFENEYRSMISRNLRVAKTRRDFRLSAFSDGLLKGPSVSARDSRDLGLNHFVTEIAASTFTVLDAFTRRDFLNGFFPRYLFWTVDDGIYIDSNAGIPRIASEAEAVRLTQPFEMEEDPEFVMTEEAQDVVNRFGSVCDDILQTGCHRRKTLLTPVFKRFHELTMRLCVLTAERGRGRYVIGEEQARWACSVITKNASNIMGFADFMLTK